MVQVWQLDTHGRNVLRGYGFRHLPSNPGFSEVSVPCWRPSGTMQVRDSIGLPTTPAQNNPCGRCISELMLRLSNSNEVGCVENNPERTTKKGICYILGGARLTMVCTTLRLCVLADVTQTVHDSFSKD